MTVWGWVQEFTVSQQSWLGKKITEKYKYNKYTVISHRRLFSQTHVSNILNILTSIHSSSPLWCSYHYITYFSYDMLIHLHINGQGSWAVVDHTKREKAGSCLKRGSSSTLFIAIMSIYRHVFYLPYGQTIKFEICMPSDFSTEIIT